MCTHNARGDGIGCQAVHTPYIYIIYFGDKHKSVHEEIEMSPPNFIRRRLASLANYIQQRVK